MIRQTHNSLPPLSRPGRARKPWAAQLMLTWAICGVLLAGSGCNLAQVRTDQPTLPASSTMMNSGQAIPSVNDSTTQTSDQDGAFHKNATVRQKFQVHLDFGRVFEAEGNYDSAVMEYQDALNVFKDRKQGGLASADQALAHRRMGGALDKLGRFPQAEEHYKQALQLDPKNPKIWNDAGYSYYLQGKLPQAQQALLTGNKLAPDDHRIRTNLGLTLAAAGQTADALPLLSETTGDAVGHLNLGYLLAANRQYELARQQYETALAMRPDLAIARRALAQLDRQQYGISNVSLPPIQVAAAPKPKTNAADDPSLVQAATATTNPKPSSSTIPPPVIPKLPNADTALADSLPTLPSPATATR
jgi:Tfp pilus assembly protein PilF